MADKTIVNGVYKPAYNWGAPSCIYPSLFFLPTVKPLYQHIPAIHQPSTLSSFLRGLAQGPASGSPAGCLGPGSCIEPRRQRRRLRLGLLWRKIEMDGRNHKFTIARVYAYQNIV